MHVPVCVCIYACMCVYVCLCLAGVYMCACMCADNVSELNENMECNAHACICILRSCVRNLRSCIYEKLTKNSYPTISRYITYPDAIGFKRNTEYIHL